MSRNPQNHIATPQPRESERAAVPARRSRIASRSLGLLLGIAASCLLWPLLVHAGVQPIVAVPLLAALPLFVWALVEGLRAVARRWLAARRDGALEPERKAASADAAERDARGELGWIVELSAAASRRVPATVIRVVLLRTPDGERYEGTHALSRAGRAAGRERLAADAATGLGRWLDASSPWRAAETPRAARDPAPGDLPITIAIASFGGGAVRHATLSEALGVAPRETREFWVHSTLARVFDLGSKAPWLRIELRGHEVRWFAARPGDASFRPDVAGVSFWVGPDEREPDELAVTIADAKTESGERPRWPDAIGTRSTFVAPLPAPGAAGVSTLDLRRRTTKRPGSAVERHGGWALIDGDSVTFWFPVVVGVHAALLHRALGIGAEPSLRI